MLVPCSPLSHHLFTVIGATSRLTLASGRFSSCRCTLGYCRLLKTPQPLLQNPNFLLSPGREWPADRRLPGSWSPSAQSVPRPCGSPFLAPGRTAPGSYSSISQDLKHPRMQGFLHPGRRSTHSGSKSSSWWTGDWPRRAQGSTGPGYRWTQILF